MINYQELHRIVFSPSCLYPGHTPSIKELPNGDGKVDSEKRYAHISDRHLYDCGHLPLEDWTRLAAALFEAHRLAKKVAAALGVPAEFMPKFRHGALRVLEYPVGATSNVHTDFDLFTIMIYRDQPDCFIPHYCKNFGTYPRAKQERERLLAGRKINSQLHLGELGELLGLGPATPHEVIASDRVQRSIVYFAIPDHAAVLPSGETVRDWLAERMGRSRVPA